jgi:diguanylate cyclase (GGDEF)-like protein
MLVFLLLAARPAAAQADGQDHAVPSFAPACHAATDAARPVAAMRARGGWVCDNIGWTSQTPVFWLRFEASAWAGKDRPSAFFTRIARFQSITFTAIDADGTARTARHSEADAQPYAAGPVFRLPLPAITPATTLLLVRVEGPHSVPLLTEARITSDPAKAAGPRIDLMLLAFVMGMLVLPLLFDISFYLVLRERFVLIHAGMVSAMMVYILTAGGLANAYVAMPTAQLAVLGPLSYAIGAGLSALFLVAFLEKGALLPVMRRLTIGAGWFTILVPGFCSLQLDATQGFDDTGYFIAFIPCIFGLTAAIITALWRSSRSARFIAVAWMPIILASIERLLRGLGLYVGPSSLDEALYVAVGIEVVVISLAIADRFLAIRLERDAARTEAAMLEQISTRDGLTGLMNRRALEARFDEFLAQGFDTFALVDLDRFKAINDVHGHQTGDAALVACAAALRAMGDRDTVAVRLGGEEFVVLLRGPRPLERAEALRQAIPLRIMQEIPELDQPVTASMGVVMLAHPARHRMSFSEFYARADALMYEAKASGRNRIAYERMTVFDGGAEPQGRAA